MLAGLEQIQTRTGSIGRRSPGLRPSGNAPWPMSSLEYWLRRVAPHPVMDDDGFHLVRDG
jgi:hypothetical protein